MVFLSLPAAKFVKALIVVPAFNESQIIYSVLETLPKKITGISSIEVVVINDGSVDDTQKEVSKANIKLLSHIINRGLGAAIKTGLTYAKENNFDIMITFDGDGQHNPLDIKRIVKPLIKREADLVIGSRFRSKQKAPWDRLIINWLANAATLMFFGVATTDSQSGLRAFSKKAINLIDYKADRMDFSSEILMEAKRNKLKIAEVPTTLIYTTYSRKKGQKNINAFSVLAKILVRLFR